LTPVLVVAGSAATRRGLAGLLLTTDDFQPVATAGWESLLQEGADLLLGELAVGDAVPVFALPVLLLTDRRETILQPGPGRGQLRRDASDQVVLAALRAVREGLWVTDGPADPGRAQGPDALTPRELEVLELLAEGLGNRQLAAALGISENTVKFHLSSLFSKLDATTRTEAVRAGIRGGYLLV
jgi:DNA-binding NarL/FixJ family response regulator